ncbi:MAG: hypothetical protein Q4B28_08590 [bacterium]|nr:hypothetical protein [bacterium]
MTHALDVQDLQLRIVPAVGGCGYVVGHAITLEVDLLHATKEIQKSDLMSLSLPFQVEIEKRSYVKGEQVWTPAPAADYRLQQEIIEIGKEHRFPALFAFHTFGTYRVVLKSSQYPALQAYLEYAIEHHAYDSSLTPQQLQKVKQIQILFSSVIEQLKKAHPERVQHSLWMDTTSTLEYHIAATLDRPAEEVPYGGCDGYNTIQEVVVAVMDWLALTQSMLSL